MRLRSESKTRPAVFDHICGGEFNSSSHELLHLIFGNIGGVQHYAGLD